MVDYTFLTIIKKRHPNNIIIFNFVSSTCLIEHMGIGEDSNSLIEDLLWMYQNYDISPDTIVLPKTEEEKDLCKKLISQYINSQEAFYDKNKLIVIEEKISQL